MRALRFAEDADATKKGYYYLTLYYLGELALIKKDKKRAEYYFKRVKKLAGRRHSAYIKAKEALKKM